MRLTLRTLLAYLDDVLDPASLKEIGARVSESPSASATVARIKEVIRRRRISAPELTGSGSAPDPNLVAEYLDNTLPPDAIPALEKLCLDSDMHLAEVASSHQILTAVLGEPIEVPATTRERMYALVGQAPSVAEHSPPKSGIHAMLRDSAVIDKLPEVTKSVSPSRPVLPDYLKPAGGRNLALALTVTCVAVGWMVWVLMDQGVLPGFQDSGVASAPPVAEGAVAVPDAVEFEGGLAPDVVANSDREPVETVTEAPGSEPDALEMDGALALKEAATPEVDAGETAATLPAEADAVPMPEPNAPETKSPAVVGVVPPAEAVPVAPAGQPFPAMMYSNAEGVLLVRNRESGQWDVLPRRALVRDGDEIASPAPFQAEFTVDNSVLEVTLQRGARIRLESPKGSELLALSIDRGRITLHRPSDGNRPEPILIGLNVRGQPAQLTLIGPGTMCGIEAEQRLPQGHRPDPLLTVPDGGLYVISGQAALSWSGGDAVEVGSDVGWAAWPVPPNALVAGPQRPIPNWLTPEGIPQTNADRKWVQMFEKEFNVDQSVEMSIPSLVADRREMISAYATSTLGLIDDLPMLVKALQSEHEKTRQAAIWSLRSWLPTDPNNSARLQQEVGRIFPEEVVEDVVSLLWGYSRDDGKDPIISQKLIAYMDHKQIAIRELAFYNVSQITSRSSAHGYRPSLAESPRNAALMVWRNILEKNGGQLVK